MSATDTTPAAEATTGSSTSSARFQSIALELGLWLARVVPVQDCPQGNGISKSLLGAAAAGSVVTSVASAAAGTGSTRRSHLEVIAGDTFVTTG